MCAHKKIITAFALNILISFSCGPSFLHTRPHNQKVTTHPSKQSAPLKETSWKKALKQCPQDLLDSSLMPCYGNIKAACRLLIFVDPYCPVCHKSLQQFRKLTETRKDFLLIVHYTPLSGSHSYRTVRAILAGHANNNQQFLSTLEKATEQAAVKHKPLSREAEIKLAQIASIAPDTFVKLCNSRKVTQGIRKTIALMQHFNIDATPSYLAIGPKPRFIKGEAFPYELLPQAKQH